MSNELEELLAAVNAQKAKIEDSRGGSGPRARFWKPEAGENTIRVMPKWDSELKGRFWREVAQHWNVGEDQKGPILCPRETPDLSGECPICDLVQALRADKSNVEGRKLADDIRAKKTYLLNIVDQKDPVYTAADVAEFKQSRPEDDVPFDVGDPRIQIYACPTTVFEAILGIMSTAGTDITDFQSGRDIRVKKTPNKQDRRKTRYEVYPVLDTRDTGYGETLELPNLSQVGFTLDTDGMYKLLSEGRAAAFLKALPGESSASVASLTADGASADQSETAPVSASDLEEQMRAGLNG